MSNSFSTRVASATAEAIVEILKGDRPGHPFHGNQWTDGEGSSDAAQERITIKRDEWPPSSPPIPTAEATANLNKGIEQFNAAGGRLESYRLWTMEQSEIKSLVNGVLKELKTQGDKWNSGNEDVLDERERGLFMMNQALLQAKGELTDWTGRPIFTFGGGILGIARDSEGQVAGVSLAHVVQDLPMVFERADGTKETREPEPTYLYLDYVGTTGKMPGVGSAALGFLMKNAGASSWEIHGEPAEGAVSFWQRTGANYEAPFKPSDKVGPNGELDPLLLTPSKARINWTGESTAAIGEGLTSTEGELVKSLLAGAEEIPESSAGPREPRERPRGNGTHIGPTDPDAVLTEAIKGDKPGHAFRGNQYTGGRSSGKASDARESVTYEEMNERVFNAAWAIGETRSDRWKFIDKAHLGGDKSWIYWAVAERLKTPPEELYRILTSGLDNEPWWLEHRPVSRTTGQPTEIDPEHLTPDQADRARLDFVDNMRVGWFGSSGDTAHADYQNAAVSEFGLKDTAPLYEPDPSAPLTGRGGFSSQADIPQEVMQDFLRAQYEVTQQVLKDAGFKPNDTVTLWRSATAEGAGFPSKPEPGTETTASFRPLVGWGSGAFVSAFSDLGIVGPWGESERTVYSAKVPVKEIASLGGYGGMGDAGTEAVVLGGPRPITVGSRRDAANAAQAGKAIAKGDRAGHAFHGNQWTGGRGSGDREVGREVSEAGKHGWFSSGDSVSPTPYGAGEYHPTLPRVDEPNQRSYDLMRRDGAIPAIEAARHLERNAQQFIDAGGRVVLDPAIDPDAARSAIDNLGQTVKAKLDEATAEGNLPSGTTADDWERLDQGTGFIQELLDEVYIGPNVGTYEPHCLVAFDDQGRIAGAMGFRSDPSNPNEPLHIGILGSMQTTPGVGSALELALLQHAGGLGVGVVGTATEDSWPFHQAVGRRVNEDLDSTWSDSRVRSILSQVNISTDKSRTIDQQGAIAAEKAIVKGDRAGHAFRGNQWTGGISSGKEAPPIREEQIKLMQERILDGYRQEYAGRPVPVLRDMTPDERVAAQLKGYVAREIAGRMTSSTDDLISANPIGRFAGNLLGTFPIFEYRADVHGQPDSTGYVDIRAEGRSFYGSMEEIPKDGVFFEMPCGLGLAHISQEGGSGELTSEMLAGGARVDRFYGLESIGQDKRAFIDAISSGSADGGSPAVEDMVRSQCASRLIQSWAETSNNDSPTSLRIQEAAQRVFGMEQAFGWSGASNATQESVSNTPAVIAKVYEDFVKAQYDLTQEQFRASGIGPNRQIELYRGTQQDLPPIGTTQDFAFRPLSATASSPDQAIPFTGRGPEPILQLRVPASEIFSTPYTGSGCRDEDEVIIKGGVKQATVVQPGPGGVLFGAAEKSWRSWLFKGDKPGHKFHGNQWVAGEGGESTGVNHIAPNFDADIKDWADDLIRNMRRAHPETQDLAKDAVLKRVVSEDLARRMSSSTADLYEATPLGHYSYEVVKDESGKYALIQRPDATQRFDPTTFAETGGFLSTNWEGSPISIVPGPGVTKEELAQAMSAPETTATATTNATKEGWTDSTSTSRIVVGDKEYGPFLLSYAFSNRNQPWAPADSYEADRMIRSAAASSMVGLWAMTSNDDHQYSLAMQDAAKAEFGLKQTAEWKDLSDEMRQKVQGLMDQHGAVYQDFLRSQYDATQEFLRKMRIDENDTVTLYRGQRSGFPRGIQPGEVFEATMRPLSAWTTSRGIASEPYFSMRGKVFTTEIPATEILATPATGVGCYTEDEVVVLGAAREVAIVRRLRS